MAKTATRTRPAGAGSAGRDAAGSAAKATLTISSKNYSSWSLRGWLLCKMAGLDFEERIMPSDDPSTRAELLLLSPSFLVPKLTHDGVAVWDTLAIGGEMHSGFANLRAALAMNIKARHPGFKVWAGAQADIDRIATIWRDCLTQYGGTYLFGTRLTMADAMYAPVCTRFVTYDVKLDGACAQYCQRIMSLPYMQEWIQAATAEPDEVEELDVEF
jgi:glutathione S-transferase